MIRTRGPLCAIITTKATDDLTHIHDRMPVCVPPEAWEAWLDPPSLLGSDLSHLLEPLSEGLHAYPVTHRDHARNNGADLLEPVIAALSRLASVGSEKSRLL